jgi:hypothetical protein
MAWLHLSLSSQTWNLSLIRRIANRILVRIGFSLVTKRLSIWFQAIDMVKLTKDTSVPLFTTLFCTTVLPAHYVEEVKRGGTTRFSGFKRTDF